MNDRFGTALLRAAFVFAVAVSIGSAPRAAPVTVTGTFTSFSSWIFDPSVRQSLVNGTALSSSGVPVGLNGAINYYQSNTLTFGVPTSSVDFTYGPAGFTTPFPLNNNFSLAGGGGDVTAAGQDFSLGTFSFTNGQWYPFADVGFLLTTQSSDPAFNGHTFSGFLHLTSNTGNGTAASEADFFDVTVDGMPIAGGNRAWVYEEFIQPPGNPGFTGSFALMGHIGSLDPTVFVSLNSAGFTTPFAAPVPEPDSYAILLAGLGLLGFAARRRGHKFHTSP